MPLMDPETREMIETTLELARENNKMLRKVRGVQQREMIWRIVKTAVILGLALGLFYFLEPVINQIIGVYSSIFGSAQNAADLLQGI
jgi:hypothetical protein